MIRVLIEMEIPLSAYGDQSLEEAMTWELTEGLRDIDPLFITRHEVTAE